MGEEKLGTIIVDGRIIDLDKEPLENLIKLQEKIQQYEDEKTKEIEEFIQQDENFEIIEEDRRER